MEDDMTRMGVEVTDLITNEQKRGPPISPQLQISLKNVHQERLTL